MLQFFCVIGECYTLKNVHKLYMSLEVQLQHLGKLHCLVTSQSKWLNKYSNSTCLNTPKCLQTFRAWSNWRLLEVCLMLARKSEKWLWNLTLTPKCIRLISGFSSKIGALSLIALPYFFLCLNQESIKHIKESSTSAQIILNIKIEGGCSWFEMV